MHFITTSGERTPEELAARIFGTKLDDPITIRAAKALLRANPALRETKRLPNTVVTVPDVSGAVPAVATVSLPVAAGEMMLSGAQDHLADLSGVLAEVAKGRVEAAQARRARLDDAASKSRARGHAGYSEWRREAKVRADADITLAKARVGALETAVVGLAADLDALRGVLTTSASSFPTPPRAKRPATARNAPVHTVPHGDGWANRREGASRVSRSFATKAEAQRAGRKIAERDRTQHVIHKQDGTIAAHADYSSPAPSRKGTR